jgi:outer membrane lipoprotein SlyB
MFKRIIAIVLSAGLLFAITGCSSTTTSSKTAYSSQADHQFLKDYADNPMEF